MSALPYDCTSWTLTKYLEKKLDENCTKMLRAVLNKSWKQYPTKRQLCGHLPPILQTIYKRRAKNTWHSLRSKDKIRSNLLLWTPTHGHTSIDQPAKSYIHQLWADNGCRLEDSTNVMTDRDGWRERGSKEFVPSSGLDEVFLSNHLCSIIWFKVTILI